ncbi:DUF1254 domain-containing protein [Compostimonas suwonensis]|uniref:DUF1254 domain-containing protein n=1 Tax=Compostimonas suwonensis TaxID=1048394 RepID=A0A2M9C0L6_9MICO|nr:DUF1254 domain-containing protein [Compostimonas suwonensis]PJJ63864.1 hypothetical protein CLV54_1543 [Compostimonas suwonensis]
MSILADDLRTLSREAYMYLYPLVTMEISRQQVINLEADARPGFGPANEFHHLRTFPPADFRAVVRPNFDTLYANAWFDLTSGPVLLRVPDTDDRYYMLPMLDMWTDVFATVGKRTTGTGAQEYVLVGPGYAGPLPEGVTVIASPTSYGWIIGRIQTNGPSDYAAVHAVQDGLSLTPLVASPPHVIDPDHDSQTEALTIANRMDAFEFFTYAAEALKTTRPHATDFSILARIANLGIIPGRSFNADRFDLGQREQIQAGASDALHTLIDSIPTMGTATNGWTNFSDTTGVYGNDYFTRAGVTLAGLGANPPEDAIYPLLVDDADGDPVVGDRDYVLHFDADRLPPVAAFWSVTMYDAEGFQAANELDRFAIGDRNPLTYNPDGSLDIYIQHTNPGPDREPNWLPAPLGPLGINMRLYAPAPEALDGRWNPPAVRKA